MTEILGPRPLAHVYSVSTGKDSTAALLVGLETAPQGVAHYAFADTGNEDRRVYDYLEYLEGKLSISIARLRRSFDAEIARKRDYVMLVWPEEGVPLHVCERAAAACVPSGNPFLDLCIWKGRFPSRKAQFCTQFLKTQPLVEYQIDLIDQGYDVWSWQGVRRDESLARRYRPGFEVVGGGLYINRPIIDWPAEATFEAMAYYGVQPNPLYSMGFKRVGCMPCVNSGKDDLLNIAKRFPEVIDRLEQWESAVSLASKRGASTFFHKGPGESPGDVARELIFEQARIRNMVNWSKTSRGGRQYDLLRTLIEPLPCSSSYGLCE